MRKLNQKTYLKLTGLLFTIVALVHLLRFFVGWEANIAGWDVPTWLSIVGAAVAGYLAYSAYKLMR